MTINDQNAADLADALRFSREEGLASTFTIRFPQPGGGLTDYTFTRAAALTHALTHAHWHRAQAVNMLRHLNVPGVSDKLPEIAVTEWQAEGEAFYG